jgi:hypothetical protein
MVVKYVEIHNLLIGLQFYLVCVKKPQKECMWHVQLKPVQGCLRMKVLQQLEKITTGMQTQAHLHTSQLIPFA